jgi:hypothetical protein
MKPTLPDYLLAILMGLVLAALAADWFDILIR